MPSNGCLNPNTTLQTPLSPSEVHQYAPAYYPINPASTECITKLQYIASLVIECLLRGDLLCPNISW